MARAEPPPQANPSAHAQPRVLHAQAPRRTILTSKAALEGERKQVTVLFADLKGSMELLADRDPEEARKLLDPVLERMMEAVHRYEGTVNQVMGDGIMALFGAPLAHEDHAVRACYAALDMQRGDAAADRGRSGGPTASRSRSGSASTPARWWCARSASDLRMDYTAVGQTTHLAARMEQLASPGTTLLTADTLRLAEGYVEVKPLGAMPVKGLPAPVEAYELTGAGPRRSRLSAAAARGLTRFVGRDGELEQLREALGRAAQGHGQVVAIVGEPGVGKSRLVWEVTHSHRTHGWLILEAGSVSYGKATPYLPVVNLLRGYFQIGDRDEPRAIREKVTGKLLTLDRALEPALPAFLALLDVPVEDRRWEVLDPPQRRQRTIDALRRLLLRESQVQPLLVVFEDLHWIDAETQAVLDRLVESLPTARLLLLVNYRPEYRHDWGGKTYYRQLRLDPLAPESATALLETLLGGDAGLEPLEAAAPRADRGQPLLPRGERAEPRGRRGARGRARRVSAREGSGDHPRAGDGAGDPGGADRPAAAGGQGPAPDRLGRRHRRPDGRARGRRRRIRGRAGRGLARLQAAEFLYETSLFPDVEYTFKHALTHEVAYGSLLQERRRALHARAVEAIEALYPERLAEHVERLAHHALRGEAWEKAVPYLRQAGGKAMERSAYREAAAGFEQALDALRHLPESRERTEQAIDLHLDASGALVATGELAKSTDHAREAEVLAEALGDERRLGRALCRLATRAWIAGDPDRALELGQRASPSPSPTMTSLSRHGRTSASAWSGRRRGNYRQAAECLSRVAEALQGDRRYERMEHRPADPSSRGSGSPGASPSWASSPRRWRAPRRPSGSPARSIIPAASSSPTGASGSSPSAAATSRRPSRRSSAPSSCAGSPRRRSSSTSRPRTSATRTRCRAASPRAWPSWRRRSPTPRRRAPPTIRCSWPTSGRRISWPAAGTMRSRSPGAPSTSRTGRRSAATRRGSCASSARSPRRPTLPTWSQPQEHYGRALARADELGMRPLVAHCHLGLGKLYRRTGDQAKAQEHLTTAATMYREMDMRFWLEKAEAELGGVER